MLVKRLLDDFERMKLIDKSNMLGFCVDAENHYHKAAKIGASIEIGYPKPSAIIIAGMGGSAIGGELLKDWARDKIKIPIEVIRDYHLPAYADEKTLVLVSSYSGDTEESLSAFLDAIKRKCMIFCLSSGGAIISSAEKLKVPYVRVPTGMAPRVALPYMFIPLLFCMEKLGLVSGVASEVEEALTVLDQVVKENLPTKPSEENLAKTFAMNLEGLVPIIYGFDFYRAVAQRFKQQFNENSKIAAKWEYFPELDHNEVVGWQKSEQVAENFAIIFIRDKDEPVGISSRIEITKRLIEPIGVDMYEIYSQGKGILAKMISTICLGDFISVYLAIYRKIDPTPVPTIITLKNELQKNGLREEIIKELGKIKL